MRRPLFIRLAVTAALMTALAPRVHAQQPVQPAPKGALGAGSYQAKHIIIATGARPRALPGLEGDGKLIWIFIFAALLSQIISLFALLSFYGLGFPLAILYGGFAALINLVLLIAAVVLIYFWCQPGEPGPNAYGPVPPVFDPSRTVSPPA